MTRRGLALILAALAGARVSEAQTPYRGLAKGEVLRGGFTQERRIKGFERPLVSGGDFVLAPGLGLIWRTQRPFAIATVITASGLVQDVGGIETTRLSSQRLPFLARLYDLLGASLSGDWKVLETQFQVRRHGDVREWDLLLVPDAGVDPLAMPFQTISLRGGQFLDEVRIVRLDGDSDRLVFSDQTRAVGGLTGAELARLREAGK